MAPAVSVEADVQTRMRRGTRAIGQGVQEALGQASDGQVFANVTKDFAAKEHRIRNTDAHIIELDNNTQKINRLLRDLASAAHHIDDAANSASTRLLMGLQVNKRMRGMKCHEFSGGCRMRVALAKALMFQPVLLLDDPTAHLDLEAVIWLEQELLQFPNCMVLVSHSADFLDAVCNKICVLENKKLSYYNGNYTTFLRAKKDRVTVAKTVAFQFPLFGYPNSAVLYENLWSSLDSSMPGRAQRKRYVSPTQGNTGKSTLMKLFARELHPLDGQVVAHTHCRFIKDTTQPADPDRVRSLLGQFDISGTAQTMLMARLSGGQLVRVCFAWLAVQQPNILLLDEPSNGLDLDTIDALASAINAFEGGVLVISHDFRLVNQIAKEIWICDNGQIVKFPSSKTIMDNKEDMRKGLEVKLERRKRVMNSLGAGRK
ncbi:ABC transporter [Carpediemonas membranifera]|uniref:ABC transporter n=1 Tax=Carpediemonas membranifera TaxID=201153 RepID=A0A8J6AU85_9EUKA|nr:ABC transporter [Carpediemonas membranifera]|eukprot:KAG9394846.1 ABC transporter [Carpediemonas membranifera]